MPYYSSYIIGILSELTYARFNDFYVTFLFHLIRVFNRPSLFVLVDDSMMMSVNSSDLE